MWMKTEEQELIKKRYLKKLQKWYFDKAPVFWEWRISLLGKAVKVFLFQLSKSGLWEWRDRDVELFSYGHKAIKWGHKPNCSLRSPSTVFHLSVTSGPMALGETEQLSIIPVLQKVIYALLTEQQLMKTPWMFWTLFSSAY